MRKHILYISFITILITIFCLSCIDENYYKGSSKNDILVLDILGQVENKIEYGKATDTGLVSIAIPSSFDKHNLKVRSFKSSPLSFADKDILNTKDFSQDVILKIRAENGNTKIWKINIYYSVSLLQIPFSNMKEWRIAKDENGNNIMLNNNTYAYFPGRDNSYSPWQHAAKANTIIGFFSVNPKPNAQMPQYASLETSFYSLGTMFNSAIVTGGLFTGHFLFNTLHIPGFGQDPNPRKMVDFGVPFYKKPSKVRFKMRYSPGEIMKDGYGKEILPSDALNRPNKDSCEIYFLLQNRNIDSTKYYRIGAAWLRTSENIGNFNTEDGFVEITLPFIYGQPSQEEINTKPYMKIGGVRGELIYYKFIPNGLSYDKIKMEEEYGSSEMEVDNIIIVLSSSAYGDMFWGAPGSKLDIKDIELIY